VWWNFHFFCTYLLIIHTRNSIQQPGLARDWTGRIFLGGKGVELDFISCQVCSARWNLVCGAFMKYTNTVAPKEEDCERWWCRKHGWISTKAKTNHACKTRRTRAYIGPWMISSLRNAPSSCWPSNEWRRICSRVNYLAISLPMILNSTHSCDALQCCAYWWKQFATPLPPSFKECLVLELHPFGPDEFDLNICLVDIPILTAQKGLHLWWP